MNKQMMLGAVKSKTINTNVALTILITWLASTYGIPLPPEVAPAAIAILYGTANVFLRFLTNKSISDKGINIPNPLYIENVIKTITQDDKNIEQLHTAMKEWLKKKKQAGG